MLIIQSETSLETGQINPAGGAGLGLFDFSSLREHGRHISGLARYLPFLEPAGIICDHPFSKDFCDQLFRNRICGRI